MGKKKGKESKSWLDQPPAWKVEQERLQRQALDRLSPIHLACEHTTYYPLSHVPEVGDLGWCWSCTAWVVRES